MNATLRFRPAVLLLSVPVLAVSAYRNVTPGSADVVKPGSVATASGQSFPVSGTGLFLAPTTIIHSEEPTPTGMIQQSTSVLSLSGDMSGWIVFHATSVFDFVNGTLVNTGTQIFSGTVAGSEPLILHDDEFRFDIDLTTGATTGVSYFSRSGDAPNPGGWYDCDLLIVGTGVTPDGNMTSDYTGTCTPRGTIR